MFQGSTRHISGLGRGRVNPEGGKDSQSADPQELEAAESKQPHEVALLRFFPAKRLHALSLSGRGR